MVCYSQLLAIINQKFSKLFSNLWLAFWWSWCLWNSRSLFITLKKYSLLIFLLWFVLFVSYLTNLFIKQGHNIFSFRGDDLWFLDVSFRSIIISNQLRYMVWGKGWVLFFICIDIHLLQSNSLRGLLFCIEFSWHFCQKSIECVCMCLFLDFIYANTILSWLP